MRWMPRLVVAGTLVFALTQAAPGLAEIPDPDLITVPDILTVTPDASRLVRIIIIGQLGPLSGSMVEITFTPTADALIAWGTGQSHPSVTSITNAAGEADFYLAGGGCVVASGVGVVVAQVTADGIPIGESKVVNSPDAVNSAGQSAMTLGAPICESGQIIVGLSDATYHTQAISQGTVQPCSKFSGDPADPVGIQDAVIVTPYLVAGTVGTCP